MNSLMRSTKGKIFSKKNFYSIFKSENINIKNLFWNELKFEIQKTSLKF